MDADFEETMAMIMVFGTRVFAWFSMDCFLFLAKCEPNAIVDT